MLTTYIIRSIMYTLDYLLQEVICMNSRHDEPYITVQDIMVKFKCEIDKATEIMKNPDLKRFPVGRTYYVTRERFETFLENLEKYNGLRDLSQGFSTQMTYGYRAPVEWMFLIKIGFTPEQIMEVINGEKENRA